MFGTVSINYSGYHQPQVNEYFFSTRSLIFYEYYKFLLNNLKLNSKYRYWFGKKYIYHYKKNWNQNIAFCQAEVSSTIESNKRLQEYCYLGVCISIKWKQLSSVIINFHLYLFFKIFYKMNFSYFFESIAKQTVIKNNKYSIALDYESNPLVYVHLSTSTKIQFSIWTG